MDVSIVIRTKNEAEFIEETLKRLKEQEFCGDYEVIIVDSGSTDSTLDIIRKYNVRLVEIPQERFSYGRSLNIGGSMAQGKFVVNLSAHALPRDKKWLTNLIKGFEDDNVAGVYGRQASIGRLNPFEALQNELFFTQERITFNLGNKKVLKKIHFSNSNSAIRKDVWRRFTFNEQLPYAEDIWWQTQVMQAGFSILYCPEALVHHTHRVSIRNAYKYSRDCAHTLALMEGKRQSVHLILYDVGILLGLLPGSIFQNLRYVCKKKYFGYVTVAPFYVISRWLGWLTGRAIYRMKK